MAEIDPWKDLVKAVELLAVHKTGESPFHCEHDELFVMSDPDKYDADELAQLEEWGFFVNDDDGFSSYRYGSA